MRKFFLFPVLVLALVLGLQACNPNKPIPNDTIVVGIEQKPEQLDPRLAVDSFGQKKIGTLIYNGLLTLDENMNFAPCVASAYEIVDPTMYRFHLRRNVLFHNGKPLTSADVRATYESEKGAFIKSPYKEGLSIITTIDTPDENTVIFHLKEPSAPFLTYMTTGLVPKEYVDGDNAANAADRDYPSGTGPYKLSSVKDSLNIVELERFDKYFGDRAKTKHIIFRTIMDSNLRILELLHGRIDMAQSNTPFMMIPKLKERKTLSYVESPGTVFAYLAFNFKNTFLKDLRVRKAFAHIIDTERIMRYKLSGVAVPATSILGPSHWAFNKTLSPYSFNPNEAKELLDEAGFKDRDGDGPLPRFKLVYKTSSLKERVEIAQLIAEQLKAVGIELEVKPYEFGTFFRDVRQGNFDIYTLTWSGITDPDMYYSIAHSEMTPPAGVNRGYYNNPTLDPLLEKSRITLDPQEQKKIYNEIQRIVFDDLVYVPLWYENNYAFLNPRLKGYTPRPNANFLNLVNAYKVNE
jgi:peptide/nickel transport system substrate-binding protein